MCCLNCSCFICFYLAPLNICAFRSSSCAFAKRIKPTYHHYAAKFLFPPRCLRRIAVPPAKQRLSCAIPKPSNFQEPLNHNSLQQEPAAMTLGRDAHTHKLASRKWPRKIKVNFQLALTAPRQTDTGRSSCTAWNRGNRMALLLQRTLPTLESHRYLLKAVTSNGIGHAVPRGIMSVGTASSCAVANPVHIHREQTATKTSATTAKKEKKTHSNPKGRNNSK